MSQTNTDDPNSSFKDKTALVSVNSSTTGNITNNDGNNNSVITNNVSTYMLPQHQQQQPTLIMSNDFGDPNQPQPAPQFIYQQQMLPQYWNYNHQTGAPPYPAQTQLILSSNPPSVNDLIPNHQQTMVPNGYSVYQNPNMLNEQQQQQQPTQPQPSQNYPVQLTINPFNGTFQQQPISFSVFPSQPPIPDQQSQQQQTFVPNTNSYQSQNPNQYGILPAHRSQQQQPVHVIQLNNNNNNNNSSNNNSNNNGKTNRAFVPLYCGLCRAYGCQCFYRNSNSNSASNTNTSASENSLPINHIYAPMDGQQQQNGSQSHLETPPLNLPIQIIPPYLGPGPSPTNNNNTTTNTSTNNNNNTNQASSGLIMIRPKQSDHYNGVHLDPHNDANMPTSPITPHFHIVPQPVPPINYAQLAYFKGSNATTYENGGQTPANSENKNALVAMNMSLNGTGPLSPQINYQQYVPPTSTGDQQQQQHAFEPLPYKPQDLNSNHMGNNFNRPQMVSSPGFNNTTTMNGKKNDNLNEIFNSKMTLNHQDRPTIENNNNNNNNNNYGTNGHNDRPKSGLSYGGKKNSSKFVSNSSQSAGEYSYQHQQYQQSAKSNNANNAVSNQPQTQFIQQNPQFSQIQNILYRQQQQFNLQQQQHQQQQQQQQNMQNQNSKSHTGKTIMSTSSSSSSISTIQNNNNNAGSLVLNNNINNNNNNNNNNSNSNNSNANKITSTYYQSGPAPLHSTIPLQHQNQPNHPNHPNNQHYYNTNNYNSNYQHKSHANGQHQNSSNTHNTNNYHQHQHHKNNPNKLNSNNNNNNNYNQVNSNHHVNAHYHSQTNTNNRPMPGKYSTHNNNNVINSHHNHGPQGTTNNQAAIANAAAAYVAAVASNAYKYQQAAVAAAVAAAHTEQMKSNLKTHNQILKSLNSLNNNNSNNNQSSNYHQAQNMHNSGKKSGPFVSSSTTNSLVAAAAMTRLNQHQRPAAMTNKFDQNKAQKFSAYESPSFGGGGGAYRHSNYPNSNVSRSQMSNSSTLTRNSSTTPTNQTKSNKMSQFNKSSSLTPGVTLSSSSPPTRIQSQTLCRLGQNCKYRRENKCKYYHPTPQQTSNPTIKNKPLEPANSCYTSKKEDQIDIAEYKIEEHLKNDDHEKTNNENDSKSRTEEQSPAVNGVYPLDEPTCRREDDQTVTSETVISDVSSTETKHECSLKISKSLSSSTSSLCSSKTITNLTEQTAQFCSSSNLQIQT